MLQREGVHVVLNDHDIITPADIHQLPAAVLGNLRQRGVLAGRHQIQPFDAPGPASRFQRIGQHPLLIHPAGRQVEPQAAGKLLEERITELLGGDTIPRVEQGREYR